MQFKNWALDPKSPYSGHWGCLPILSCLFLRPQERGHTPFTASFPPTQTQNPHCPPAPLPSDGIPRMGSLTWEDSSCPSVSCIYTFGVCSSLSPRLLHLRPSEVHWDAPQRINDSTVEEVAEEKHFTAKGKAGAITKKLESERLGVAGGVLEGGWAAPGVTSPASRARRVTPSR